MILKHSKILPIFLAILFIMSCRTEPTSDATLLDTEVPAVINARLRAEPDGLFPFNTSKSWSLEIVRHVFHYLMFFNAETLEIEPVLCKTRPEITNISEGVFAGGMKLKFELLDEATWDNGTPITAKDFEFTLKAIFNPEAKGLLKLYQQEMTIIKKFEIDSSNPKIFTISTGEPYLKTEENIASFVLPAYNYDPDGLLSEIELNDLLDSDKAKALGKSNPNLAKFAEQIISPEFALDPSKISGSGPYRVSEWIEGERIVLEKKENWWGDQLRGTRKNLTAYPKSLSFVFVRDNNATLTMLKNGELDIAGIIEANSFNQMKEDPAMQEKFDFVLHPTQLINYLGVNNVNPKLTDPKVRQALSYLIDRETICESVYTGYATPIYTEMPKGSPYYKEYPTPFNVDKAISLLEEAGWNDNDGNGIREKVIDGNKTEMTLEVMTTPNNVISESIVRILSETCKKAGVQITNSQKEAREYIGARNRGEFELWAGAMRIPPGAFDPSAYWKTESATNYFKSGSVEMDNLIDAIIVNQDESQFPKLYDDYQKAWSEMQPVVFMIQSQNRIIVKKGFKDKFFSMLTPTYQLAYFK